MPLLNDMLRVWDIGFRWAGQDPDKLWIRLPLPVRDNFRMLMDAILQGHLSCFTLSVEKWSPESDSSPELYIRHHLNAVEACIWGQRFDRKLLKWATIERWAMLDWCKRQGIPLPEFWFPPGWKLDYEWEDDDPDGDTPAQESTQSPPNNNPGAQGGATDTQASLVQPVEAPAPTAVPAMRQGEEEGKEIRDQRRRRRIACQEVAIRIWAKQPNADVKVIANSPEVQELAGGKDSDFDVLLRWLGEIDPRDPSKRRGPKRRK